MCSLLKCENAIEFFSQRNGAFEVFKRSIPMIQEAIKVLQTAHDITKLVQRTSCTLSDFYGECIVMTEKLKLMISKRNKKTDLAKCLFDSFESRKHLFKNEALISAVCLDRRFSSALSEEETEFGKKALYRLYNRVFESVEPQQNNTDDATRNDSTTQFDLENFFIAKGCEPIETESNDTESNDTESNATEKTIVCNQQMNETEFLIMLGEFENNIPRLHHSEQMIAFWKNRKHDFPELYILSTVLNSIPPAQAAVERCFSALSFVYNCRRCQISLDHLEDILVIKLNKELVYTVFEEDMALLQIEVACIVEEDIDNLSENGYDCDQ